MQLLLFALKKLSMSKSNKKKLIKGSSSPDKKLLRDPLVQPVPQSPSWRFSGVDKGGQFSWPTEENTLKIIFEKLQSFDSMKWSEIEGKEHHYIAVDGLSDPAKERLKTIKADDEVDNLFSFRCSNTQRIFGIVLGGIVNLLWWDPKHAVCISRPKNDIKKHEK